MGTLLLNIFRLLHKIFRKSAGTIEYYQAWNYAYNISLPGIGHQQGVHVEHNGENLVLKNIIAANQNQHQVIFDIGANKGDYTSLSLQFANEYLLPGLDLHLFEPSAANHSFISKVIAENNGRGYNVKVNALGLSDKPGSMTLYSDQQGSDLGSLINLKIAVRDFKDSASETVQITTLDKYVQENRIDRIDLLKMDVEGSEFNILKGATELLRTRMVKNMQIEFGTANISSKVFLFDFWELLSKDYHFNKVLKDGIVRVEKYHPRLENFITSNYLLTLK